MKKIELRPIQKEVVDSDEPHLVVVAGAGAGKTSVLVQRYLRFVRNGIPPASILSITFTRKAAAEMKKRIVDTLRDEGLFEAAREAETGPIQTVHSFCERLLRENAILAGLDPEFEILGEAEKAEMREAAIQRAMGDPPEDLCVRELLHELAGEPSSVRSVGRQTVHARLEEALIRFIEEARGAGMSRGTLLDLYGSPESTLLQWRRTLRGCLEQAIGDIAPDDPFEKASMSAAFKVAGKARPPWTRANIENDILFRAASLTSGLVLLGCEAWRLLDADMIARQELDFTALETRSVRMLESSPEIQIRIAHNYKVVMIDEAQDLNALQYRLLNRLAIGQRLFVGDPNQSIYGWRQADYRLFRELSDIGPRRDLNENHRSDEGILNFVEFLFGRLWGGDKAYRPMVKPDAPERSFLDSERPVCAQVEVWRQPREWIPGVAKKLTELRQQVGPKPSIAVLVRRGAYANALLTQLGRLQTPARIVGGTDRFYTKLEVRDVANCLRALAEPYNDFALLATLRSPIVGVSLDAIALLGSQKPVIETIRSFVSPVVADQSKISRFLDWFEPLAMTADRVPACEILAEIFAVSGYWEALAAREDGLQMLANVRKLLKLAAESPEQDALTFAERIREIQRMNHKESDAPAESVQDGEITILTVHKAKGLEWDIVVVPDLLKDSPRQEDVEIEPALNLVTTRFTAEPESVPHALAKTLRSDRVEAESKRMLYVALTRARERLILCADSKAKSGTLAKLIAETIGLDRNPPPGLKIESAE